MSAQRTHDEFPISATAGTERPTILNAVWDPANAMTVAGLLLSTVGIYQACANQIALAMLLGLWAVLLDWWDGRVARATRNRSEYARLFGGHIDSFTDFLSSGILPGIVFLNVGQLSPIFLPGTLLLITCGALRLSYFNIYGLAGGAFYRGLPIVHNVPVIAFVVALRPVLGSGGFTYVMYGVVVALSIANVGAFAFPKFKGIAYYIFTLIVITLSIFLIAST